MVWFWLIVAVIALVIEALTTSLVSIWFAVGAFACALMALFHLPQVTQILAFFAISILCFGYARHWMEQHYIGGKVRTNLDSLIGKTAQVTQTIRPYEGGRAKVDGMDWKAVESSNSLTLEPGEPCEIVGIEGVKLKVIPLAKNYKPDFNTDDNLESELKESRENPPVV